MADTMIGKCFRRNGENGGVYIVTKQDERDTRYYEGIIVYKTHPYGYPHRFDSFHWQLPMPYRTPITTNEFLEVYKDAIEDHIRQVEEAIL